MYTNLQTIRSIIFIVGVFLILLAAFMTIPLAFSVCIDGEEWKGFLKSCIITLLSALVLLWFGKAEKLENIKVFSITSCVWLVLSVFASLPFILSSAKIEYVDGFFEAVSGLTTTGATVLTNLDKQPKEILLWRVILHAIGGLGFIVAGIVVFPILKVVNISTLFHSESSDNSEKIFASTSQIALYITAIYCAMIVICTICYYIAGMSVFDAICHSMSAVATGGFANYDDSIGHFNSTSIEVITIIFMLLGSLPLAYYLRVIVYRLFYDEQVINFFKIIIIASIIIIIWFYLNEYPHDKLTFLRHHIFTLISLISSTGFVIVDYSTWPFLAILTFFLTFVGGCSGSTASGIKVFRVIVLFKNFYNYLINIFQPNRVTVVKFNKKIIDDSIISSIYFYFNMYTLIFICSAIVLAFNNIDFMTTITAVAGTLNNTGPGLGEIVGPTGNYASFSYGIKLLFSLLMIIGRLEILAILIFLYSLFSNNN